MNDLTELAQEIVDKFRDDNGEVPFIHEDEEYDETILLYIAAKKYLGI